MHHRIHTLKNHASRFHASRKSCIAEVIYCWRIMHRGIMHCWIHTLKNHALRKSCITENHALRVNNHARREDFMPHQKLYIARIFYASLKFRHDEKMSCLVKIYTSREEFIPRWNLCIARRIHTSLKIMHHEKVMHCENHALRVSNYARWEEFMPRQNLHIARGFYSSLKVMHREKTHTSREFTYRGKIFMPHKRKYADKEREIVYPKRNLYPSASTASFVLKKKHRRWRQKRH